MDQYFQDANTHTKTHGNWIPVSILLLPMIILHKSVALALAILTGQFNISFKVLTALRQSHSRWSLISAGDNTLWYNFDSLVHLKRESKGREVLSCFVKKDYKM